jgi:hypothetical protein
MNVLIDSDDLDETPAQHDGMGKGAFTVAFQSFDKLGVWGFGIAILRYLVLHKVHSLNLDLRRRLEME